MSNDRDFDKALAVLGNRHERWRVFSDFCELAAISLGSVVRKTDEREALYKRILERYNDDERKGLPELLAITIEALEATEPTDFLGQAFMRNELMSHWHGQFFTPMPICSMMAKLTVGPELQEIVASRGFVKTLEPACGSGAMVIALAWALRDMGIEPQQKLFVGAVDLSPTCAHMALVQLSLLHLPAVVTIGDSLSLQMGETFETPAYHLGFWPLKLRRREDGQAAESVPAPPRVTDGSQLTLF